MPSSASSSKNMSRIYIGLAIVFCLTIACFAIIKQDILNVEPSPNAAVLDRVLLDKSNCNQSPTNYKENDKKGILDKFVLELTVRIHRAKVGYVLTAKALGADTFRIGNTRMHLALIAQVDKSDGTLFYYKTPLPFDQNMPAIDAYYLNSKKMKQAIKEADSQGLQEIPEILLEDADLVPFIEGDGLNLVWTPGQKLWKHFNTVVREMDFTILVPGLYSLEAEYETKDKNCHSNKVVFWIPPKKHGKAGQPLILPGDLLPKNITQK